MSLSGHGVSGEVCNLFIMNYEERNISEDGVGKKIMGLLEILFAKGWESA